MFLLYTMLGSLVQVCGKYIATVSENVCEECGGVDVLGEWIKYGGRYWR